MMAFAVDTYNFIALPFLASSCPVTTGRDSRACGRTFRDGFAGIVSGSWNLADLPHPATLVRCPPSFNDRTWSLRAPAVGMSAACGLWRWRRSRLGVRPFDPLTCCVRDVVAYFGMARFSRYSRTFALVYMVLAIALDAISRCLLRSGCSRYDSAGGRHLVPFRVAVMGIVRCVGTLDLPHTQLGVGVSRRPLHVGARHRSAGENEDALRACIRGAMRVGPPPATE